MKCDIAEFPNSILHVGQSTTDDITCISVGRGSPPPQVRVYNYKIQYISYSC